MNARRAFLFIFLIVQYGGAYASDSQDCSGAAKALTFSYQNAEITPSNVRSKVHSFRQNVSAAVDPGIAGEMVRRTSGAFAVRNVHGHVITVRFVGTTHESLTSPIGEDMVSPAEKAFLLEHLPPQIPLGTNPRLLVEQGSRVNTRDNVIGFADRVLKLKRSEYPLETALASDVASPTMPVINADLRLNPKMLYEDLKERGPEAAIQGLCLILFKEGYSIQQTEKVIFELIEALRLQASFTEERTLQVIRTYFPKLGSWDFREDEKDRLYPSNFRRDTFMAKQILEQDGDVFFVAHSAHILGVLYQLQNHILSFESDPNEIAIERWKMFKEQMSRYGSFDLKNRPTFYNEGPLL